MNRYKKYQTVTPQASFDSLTWNLYGAGLENLGKDGHAETFKIKPPNADQILVRIDAIGMCFSDIKVLKQGRKHPKLYNRDLSIEPTRLGHEVSLTVVEVGENLRDQFKPGQRFAVQPDIYQNGKSTAYGYTIPGGLTQYHHMGKEMFETDAGVCLLPLEGQIGYAEAALLEPWGCVMAAYTQRRRLTPKKDGIMWIIGSPTDQHPYQFSEGLYQPKTIILSNVPPQIKKLVKQQSKAEVIESNFFDLESIQKIAEKFTQNGFDDIVLLNPSSSQRVTEIAKTIARRGTLNLVGQEPLDGKVMADVGRLHYDYIAFIGNATNDIAASYGEQRNRCELIQNGTTVIIGAGGPMGQMHLQRALESTTGPQTLIVTEVNKARLAALRQQFIPLAEEKQKTLHILNPTEISQSLKEKVFGLNQGQGADDVIVCVPHAGLMEEAATLLNPDGMLVLFAGVPNGTLAPVEFSDIYLNNTQYTGTSGLTIDDQKLVLVKAHQNDLSPGRSVGAVGGLNAAPEAIQSTMESRYPGKIVLFAQMPDLPLMSLNELAKKYPTIQSKLGTGNSWTIAAEEELFNLVHQPK